MGPQGAHGAWESVRESGRQVWLCTGGSRGNGVDPVMLTPSSLKRSEIQEIYLTQRRPLLMRSQCVDDIRPQPHDSPPPRDPITLRRDQRKSSHPLLGLGNLKAIIGTSRVRDHPLSLTREMTAVSSPSQPPRWHRWALLLEDEFSCLKNCSSVGSWTVPGSRPGADAEGGTTCVFREGVRGHSGLSTQFCYALNSALKINVKVLNPPTGANLNLPGGDGDGRSSVRIL